jgi:hypothetical protein
MMHAYRALFERVRAQGWHKRAGRPRLSPADKLRLLGLVLSPRLALDRAKR